MKRNTLILTCCALLFAPWASASDLLLFDDFDNRDVATGGINGGFGFFDNGAGGAGSVIETGTDATVSTSKTGINNGSGIASTKSFDLKSFPEVTATLTVTQSPAWQNWSPIENLGPANLSDAPVLLTIGPDNYWMFGRNWHGGGQPGRKVGEKATLAGFDIPLQTTRFPDQFDAPGGLKPGKGGYHAWQSRDMKHWVHHGPVTEAFSKWVTTAEFFDGKAYIYYDFPNDQDPHLYIDDIEGFSKQVARTPAQLDLAELPAGFGFQVELCLTDTTENKSKPIIERMTLTFVD